LRVQTPQNQTFTNKLKADQAILKKPDWLKIRPPNGKYADVATILRAKKLATVCAEAHCPNIAECWSGGTATFMLMGDVCTRACRFCYVKSGNPRGLLDATEPRRLVEAATIMKLEYVVLTCVTRDDLPDGGAAHFAACIKALKQAHPELLIEVLISDLNGNLEALKTIVDAGPEVIAHNLETVERLQGAVRDPRANYAKSLKILEEVKKITRETDRKRNLERKLEAEENDRTNLKKRSDRGPNRSLMALRPHLLDDGTSPKLGLSSAGGEESNSTKLRDGSTLESQGMVKKIYTKSAQMLGLGETEEEVVQSMKDLRAIDVDIVTYGQYLRPSEFHVPVHEYVTPEQFKKYEKLALENGFLYCASGPFVRSSYKAGELFMKNVLRKEREKHSEGATFLTETR